MSEFVIETENETKQQEYSKFFHGKVKIVKPEHEIKEVDSDYQTVINVKNT
ncbi:hypothetical protein Dacet_2554 [Denitrovibrio acetiphilus DSM 12809]|jgi:hypothetical protein|uniref:Uncharacterized protein n=1 Tax=Denitrovibrio acetiphilus (strain DSM 12809 / NBRC 114555 / N2460) TaxID=522772 RepID=D4H4I4_DENA2|nr:hypothetical protein [Denitrovibrio acetiphilus]ADD69313.1 hypothetical protein Dacet_2554 [Denitrovibrio acetiphilus DSM 12809]